MMEKRLEQLFPDKTFRAISHDKVLMRKPTLKLQWQNNQDWEIIPDKKPCEVMR